MKWDKSGFSSVSALNEDTNPFTSLQDKSKCKNVRVYCEGWMKVVVYFNAAGLFGRA
jgi:hypothetical protein